MTFAGTRDASSSSTAKDNDSTDWVPIAGGAVVATVALLVLSVAVWCCWCGPEMRQSTNVVISNKQGTHAHCIPMHKPARLLIYLPVALRLCPQRIMVGLCRAHPTTAATHC